MQIIYDKNNIDKMLFTELVIGLTQNNDKEIFRQEIIHRLSFCEFEDKMIKYLIEYEQEILKVTNKNYDDYLYNKKYWLDRFEEKRILTLPLEKYLMYCDGKMSKNALTNSEIISINDEADFILSSGEEIPVTIFDECTMLTSLDSYANLRDQFIHRIEYIYKREMNIDYSIELFNKAMRFFINESHIIFINKYGYADREDLKWQAYTNDYYKFHNN